MLIFFKKIKSWIIFQKTLVRRLNAHDDDINNLRKRISECDQKNNLSILKSQNYLIEKLNILDDGISGLNKIVSNNEKLIQYNSNKFHKDKEQLINIQEKIIYSINDILTEVEAANKLISRHTSGLNTIVIGEKNDDV